MNCVVIPINRSDYTFESSFSAIVRSYELFSPKRIIILYAKFNKVHLEKLKNLFDELRGKGIEVRCKEIKNIDFKEFKKLIEDETNDCEKVYLVPTSGANITAVYLALYSQSKNASLVNYIFSFGPWTRYYYPFVPRSLEKVTIIGDNKPTNAKLDLNLDSYLSNTKFTRIIESMAMKLNEKLPVEKEEEELVLKIKGSIVLSTVSPNYNELRDEIAYIVRDLMSRESLNKASDQYVRDRARSIIYLSGAYDIVTENNEKLEEVSYGRSVIIDTNLIYYGIHTHEIRDIVIPYCVHNEVLWNVNEKDEFRDAVFYVYEALREKSRMVPSEL